MRWRIRTTATAVVVIGAMVVAAAAVGAGPDVKVNGDAPGTVQNEPRLTRNATDPNNFVVAYNDAVGAAATTPLGVSFSLDGGATWTDRQLGIPTHPILGTPDDGIVLGLIFDPFIDSDSNGNVYAGYVATDGSAGGPSGLFMERSTDKGSTWSGPTTISFDLRVGPPPPGSYRFNDRPDMTVDGNNDDVHVAWIKDVGTAAPTSDIYYSKSPPPPVGLDFTGGSPGSVSPQTVNDFPNGTDWANAPDVTVASDGTVYVAWINVDVTNPLPKPGTILIDSSVDGGVSFGPDLTVVNIAALASNLTTAGAAVDARSGSYPVIGTDPANPGTIYLAYSADPAGADEADIYFTRSTDGGFTWSTPVRVNDDATTNDQFHPALAVKPDGTIDLAWYDKRNAPNDDQWDVYFANSTDGGVTFAANVRITDTSFATPTDQSGTQPWLGEYLGLEVSGGTAFLSFTSSISDGRGDIYFDAQQNALPLCDGVVVTIQGTAGPDTLVGTAGPDVIHGYGGADTIDGRGGDDVICGGGGSDVIQGGPGNDRILGHGGADQIDGGIGDDDLRGNSGDDTLDGDGGADELRGNDGNDVLNGGIGADLLLGGDGDDTALGGKGADELRGNGGNDDLSGERGADLLNGGPGTDIAAGGNGRDTCLASEIETGCEL